MRIVVVRHGDAGDAGAFAASGHPDHLRPLTSGGRKRVWLAARGLMREVASVDVLASSPYLRAVQTAEVLSAVYGNTPVEQIPQLQAGAPLHPLFAWLGTQTADACVALVGHAPDLAILVTYLIAAREVPALKIKKGGAALVSFGGEVQPGMGTLRWLMDAGQLGRLAG
jgi:phosphohistidine phosphatase